MKAKKTKSIREMLTEMKNFAVLAVDLSYFSILYSNKEIAIEVTNIAHKMDSLRYDIEKAILKAASSGIDEKELIGILRLAAYSERISDVAADLADKIIKGRIHEIEKRAVKESEDQFIMLKIDKELEKKKIAEVGDIRGLWVIAIKRKKDWIYHPEGKSETKLDDILFGIKKL